MKRNLSLKIVLLFFSLFLLTNPISYAQKTIELQSYDGVKVTADVYKHSDENAPVILLFHQARFSRGEYIEIAPKLNKLGFISIAIDQRSGNKINGIINKTHLDAKKLDKKTNYVNALPDLECALSYAKESFPSSKIIVWGSSYSSSLVFILQNLHPNDIDGILSFSPGEYFKYDGKKIRDFSKNVNIPVFITSSNNEYENWKKIFDVIPNKSKTSFLPKHTGFHGSKALWKNKKGHEDYWKAVEEFLLKFQ